jgi:hypothetical protein
MSTFGQAGTEAVAPPPTRNRRGYRRALVLLVAVTAGTFVLQELVLAVILFVAISSNRPFAFDVALGPLHFWQAEWTTIEVSVPALGQVTGAGTGGAREGGLLIGFLLGALAAAIQIRLRATARAAADRPAPFSLTRRA